MKASYKIRALTLFFFLTTIQSPAHADNKGLFVGVASSAALVISIAGYIWQNSSPSDEQVIAKARALCDQSTEQQNVFVKRYNTYNDASPDKLNELLSTTALSFNSDLKATTELLQELIEQQAIIKKRIEKSEDQTLSQEHNNLQQEIKQSQTRIERLTELKKFNQERFACAATTETLKKVTAELNTTPTIKVTTEEDNDALTQASAHCVRMLASLRRAALPKENINPCTNACNEKTAALTKTVQELNSTYLARSGINTINNYRKRYNDILVANDPLIEAHTWVQGKDDDNKPYLFFCSQAHEIIVNSQRIYDELLGLQKTVNNSFRPYLTKELQEVETFLQSLKRVVSVIKRSSGYEHDLKVARELQHEKRMLAVEHGEKTNNQNIEKNSRSIRENRAETQKNSRKVQAIENREQRNQAALWEFRRELRRTVQEIKHMRQQHRSRPLNEEAPPADNNDAPPTYAQATDEPPSTYKN